MTAGDYLLGVRVNDPDLLEVCGRLLAEHTVTGVDPPPHYSLRRGVPVGGRAPRHGLDEGCHPLVRSGSLRRPVAALLAFLSARATEDAAGQVQLRLVALVRGDTAVLLPEQLRPRLGGEEAALCRRGLALADAVPALDLDGGHVRVSAPALDVDRSTLAELDNAGAADGAQPSAGPGRYRLAGWAWPPLGNRRPQRPATLAAAANRVVRNRDAVGAARALAVLVEAVTGRDRVTVPVGRVPTDAVLDAVEALW